MGKVKKKELLERIEELEKSVSFLMDINTKIALSALKHFEFSHNDSDSDDKEFLKELLQLKVVHVDRAP